MHFLTRLKIVLQSKHFLFFSLIFIILYTIVLTKIIHYNSKYSLDDTILSGVILDYNFDGDKLSIKLKGKEKVQVTYYIKKLEEKEELLKTVKIGCTINFIGNFSEPLINTIPNTFNYKKYLYNHRIYYLFNASKLEVIGKPSFFNNLKNKFIMKINSFNKSSGYLKAFILGDSGAISDEVFNLYRANGISHLFAVSGMHVGISLLLIDKIFHKFKFKDLVNIAFLCFYSFLVGWTPSILRASLFFLFSRLNRILKLNLTTLQILYFLFLLLIIIEPFYIYDLSFLYSFTTSFGLILFSKKITGNKLKKIFMVSFIAFMFSLPITLYNFYEFNLLTIINNIIVIPIISSIIFPLSLITIICPFLDSTLYILIKFLEYVNIILSNLSIIIVVPKINIYFIIIYYSVIYIIYKYGFKYVIFLFFLILCFKFKPYINSNNSIYVIDVGQGDSILLVSKNMKDVIMIDTGGTQTYKKEEWTKRDKTYKLSDNTIVFLKSLGINKLDYLIITHGDYDHMGEAINLVNNFKIKSVIFNNNNFNNLENNLIKLLTEKKIKHYENLEILKISNNKLFFLNTKIYDNENDNSNVLYFEINKYKFLFMGDAGENREKDILDKYNLSDIDFLKVGHHGSNTSSSTYFISMINPKNCLISVGKNNRYGHPKKSVLDILGNYCNIYRTDLDGSIKITINKKGYKVKTYI